MQPISVKDASKLLGWSYKYTLRMCENGQIGYGEPNKKHVIYIGRLADVLGVTADELLRKVRNGNNG